MSITRTTRTTSDPLADIAALAVHELRWACGCRRYVNDRGHTSTAIHEGAPAGHQPQGASTDITRSAHSQRKAAAKMEPRPKSVTRSNPPVKLDPLQVLQAEIKRIERRGDAKSLTEDKNLKKMHRQVAVLNAEKRVRDDADVARAKEKFRARRAQRADTIDVMHATRAELRDASLEVIERDGGHLSPAQLDAMDSLVRNVTDDVNPVEISRRVLTTQSPAYISAFRKELDPTWQPAVWTPEEAAAVTAYRMAMSEATPSSGGLGVPVLIDPTIIPSASASAAPVLGLATTVVVTTNKWSGVTSPGTSWGWRGEAVAVGDSTATLAQPSIPVYEAAGYIQHSYEVAADYPNFAAEMQSILAVGYVDMVASETVVGTGSSRPYGVFPQMMGITTNPSHIVATSVGALNSTDVRKAWQALPQRWRANATWLAHGSVETLVKGFGGTTGSSLVDYQTGLAPDGSRMSALEGRPLITTDYAPNFAGSTLGTVAAAVVGDFRNGMRVISRAGMEVETVQHVRTFRRPTAP
jgi:HK97 family phage major capsid protein